VEAPVVEAPPEPAELDLGVLRELVGDDEAVLHALLADFADSARKHAAELLAALGAHDAHAVNAVAHKLKSASRSVGALALGEACGALEAAGLAGTDVSQVLGDRFSTTLEAALQNVQARLGAGVDPGTIR
jgi:HPt (histidine-containing phosphotransfer) domain-containing protein